MKTFTEQSDSIPSSQEPLVVKAKSIKEARYNACGLLSVSGPRSLKFQAEDGSGFFISLYEGQGKIRDKNGKVIG